eukprot:748890_1
MASHFIIFVHFVLALVTCSNNKNMSPQYNISHFKPTIYNPHRPEHKIPLRIYYPQTEETNTETFPILVFGHCLLGGMFPAEYTYIWQQLVPQGYIVAFPMSVDFLLEIPFAIDIRYSLDWIMDNCTDTSSNLCPNALSRVIGTKSAVSGHSMGGGSAIMCISDMKLGQRFTHEFDSMIDLSGCGGQESYTAAKDIKKPVMFVDGNIDCMCPPHEYADVYYDNVPNDNGQCKYESLITNATHCNFADLMSIAEKDCLEREEPDCPNSNLPPHLSVKEQTAISAKYVAAFMNASLKYDNEYGALNELIKSDLESGVLFSSVSNNCE